MSSAPTSRFSRILRSASFRMTLAYVGLFVVSAGVLFATVYFTATAAMQSDMQAVLRSEAYQLGEIHRRSGLLGVAQEITKRINFRTRGPIYYLLQGPSQQVMVGNLPGMPPVNGAIGADAGGILIDSPRGSAGGVPPGTRPARSRKREPGVPVSSTMTSTQPVIDWATAPLVIKTGPTTSITLNMDGQSGNLLRASGNLKLTAAGFFTV